MVLNYIWISFFVLAFLTALVKAFVFGDYEIFRQMMNAMFDMSKTAFNISIGLTGVMAFWLGFMRVAEKGGAINVIARVLSPILKHIFPSVPKSHPAMGSMVMNFSANVLGLDNAATPLGLKAMKELQDLNDKKDTASNAQIMFLVLNTSSIMLIPVGVMALRTAAGATNPADIFLPILLATSCSSIAGLLAVSIYQKINLLKLPLVLFLLSIALFISMCFYATQALSQSELELASTFASGFIIFSILIFFIALAHRKKVEIYSEFVEGAKEGFKVAVDIIPFLVAMLVAISVFRASGALDYIVLGISSAVNALGFDTRFVDSLPTAFMKPLSGSGARALMVESMNTYGVNSFTGRLTSILQGSTETTFYILAVYFGSVKIKYTRHAVSCGLIADAAGIIAAIFIAYLFFG